MSCPVVIDVVTPGPPGGAGDSAYEIAVQEGFVGSEAQWLASLAAEANGIAMTSATAAAGSATTATTRASEAAASATSASGSATTATTKASEAAASATAAATQAANAAASAAAVATTYQPLDADLTRIAELTTAAAGRSLLTLTAVPGSALVGATDSQKLDNKTLGGLTETVFTITDRAAFEIIPADGPIQQITLLGNRTPVAPNFGNGQSVKLKIQAGAFAITWTTIGVVWISQNEGLSGTAPRLGATGWTHIELWREGSIFHGTFIGYSAT